MGSGLRLRIRSFTGCTFHSVFFHLTEVLDCRGQHCSAALGSIRLPVFPTRCHLAADGRRARFATPHSSTPQVQLCETWRNGRPCVFGDRRPSRSPQLCARSQTTGWREDPRGVSRRFYSLRRPSGFAPGGAPIPNVWLTVGRSGCDCEEATVL
ncbi:hypothetical protein GN956_G13358 [Arapaima gigas]